MLQHMFFNIALHIFMILQYLYPDVALHSFSYVCNVAVGVFRALFWVRGAWRNGMRWGSGDRDVVESERQGWVPFYFRAGERAGLESGPVSGRTRAPNVPTLKSPIIK
jgi:hypothetical protein